MSQSLAKYIPPSLKKSQPDSNQSEWKEVTHRKYPINTSNQSKWQNRSPQPNKQPYPNDRRNRFQDNAPTKIKHVSPIKETKVEDEFPILNKSVKTTNKSSLPVTTGWSNVVATMAAKQAEFEAEQKRIKERENQIALEKEKEKNSMTLNTLQLNYLNKKASERNNNDYYYYNHYHDDDNDEPLDDDPLDNDIIDYRSCNDEQLENYSFDQEFNDDDFENN